MMKTANDSTENLTPESENEKYRIGCFAPKALQYGNNSKCFLATTLALVFISSKCKMNEFCFCFIAFCNLFCTQF